MAQLKSSKRISKSCRKCGAEFSIPKCRDWREHYCSTGCRAAFLESKKAELLRTCPVCSASFSSRRNIEISTCSPQCAGIMARGRKQSPEAIANRLAAYIKNGNIQKAQQRRGPANPQFLGVKMCSGYIWVWIEGRGYVAEHRLIAELMLGRKLKNDEIVHHRNEIKHDNRPRNLAVMKRNEHVQEHRNALNLARRSVEYRRGQKLSIDSVSLIKSEIRKGKPAREIAENFGVTQTMISYIKSGKSWRHAP